jgi:hypothetical protein
MVNFDLERLFLRIEAPRRKWQGIFDPLEKFLLRSPTPLQATGNALAGFEY